MTNLNELREARSSLFAERKKAIKLLKDFPANLELINKQIDHKGRKGIKKQINKFKVNL